ncbi:pyruvate dehydrogenase complex dihydrolipoamide acetyltransferase [Chelativorans salis]|uniref:Acetyltransferase component of pyruvate dehydrogenase complex n=1 Tax=Chelativorans salis TaxID=2978478 RepID=A0ABT2LID5_9HYPH|nr:pyruvate dehydrogenase complex dihydrolipoamide acetyltransferase [Chelativorans sp. EGI FJ00035]MCT7374321.1 pyruvate dehydrogenase complex dihydrolipoamide acetyltransferase [Chelativorans sp. EGI FJ00035]
MPVEVILPKVDMDMATGRISRWHVEEGAAVEKGDLLFEIETDKAAMEIDAPAGGIVGDISGKEGVDIPVGQAVAWIYAEGEATPSSPLAGEVPAKRAEGGGGDRVPTSEEGARPSPPPPVQPPTAAVHPPRKGEGKGVRASPLARRIAKEAGIDLAAVSGSGPRGRVVKADVEAAISGGAAKAPAARAPEAPAPKPMSDEQVLRLFEEGSYELVPHDGMRKTIARRLVEAKSTIPHFYLTLDCEIDALLALRKQLNAAAPMVKTEDGEKPAYKLSVNDFIIKAMALALMAVPDANASWTESAMVKHKHADVGVAVAIPGGLITPIVRRAEAKTLSAISNEMKDLATRARNRKLKPEEYQGGTTAVSNLGMYGIKDFAAVINPPHATILAVGAGEERAVVKDGEIKPATIMSVTLSTDHRAVDGALGAELLSAFKRLVENPFGMLV